MGSEIDAWVAVALEEYKSLRDESLRALQAQQLAVQIGATIMSALLTAGLTVPSALARLMLLSTAVPLIGLLSIIVWRGEVERSIRAGAFLREREKHISRLVDHFEAQAMDWERWLARTPGFRLWLYYRAELVVFTVLSLTPVAISTVDSVQSESVVGLIVNAAGLLIAAAGACFFVVNERRLAEVLSD